VRLALTLPIGPHHVPSMLLLLLVLVIGYAVGIPAVIWGTRDVVRIPHWVWRTERAREEPWLLGMLVGCVLGGWPGAALVLGWKSSHTRVALLEDWERLDRVDSRSHDATSGRLTTLPADGAERRGATG
jgi:hypothetical protein